MLFGETVAVYWESYTEHTDTVYTSQETPYVSATRNSRLILFGKTAAVYCTTRNTQIQNVGRMKSLKMLKRVVYTVTTGI
jgi:hypothetical protein